MPTVSRTKAAALEETEPESTLRHVGPRDLDGDGASEMVVGNDYYFALLLNGRTART